MARCKRAAEVQQAQEARGADQLSAPQSLGPRGKSTKRRGRAGECDSRRRRRPPPAAAAPSSSSPSLADAGPQHVVPKQKRGIAVREGGGGSPPRASRPARTRRRPRPCCNTRRGRGTRQKQVRLLPSACAPRRGVSGASAPPTSARPTGAARAADRARSRRRRPRGSCRAAPRARNQR
jgi:hypothetical protein